MSKLRILIPALLVFAAVPAVSEAQVSIPFVKTTYSVQVKYEFWRNGNFYWSTVFQTEDEDDAELMYDLLLAAFDAGQICEVLDCGFDWIPRDVRLVVKHEYPEIVRSPYIYQSPFQKSSALPLRN